MRTGRSRFVPAAFTMALGLHITTSSAQQFEWAAVYNEDGFDLRGVAAGPDGAAYVAGFYLGTADMDPGAGSLNVTAVSSYDAFVTRFDANGEFAWSRQFGGTERDIASAVAVAPNGDVVVVGSFSGTIDLDPGPGTLNATTPGVGIGNEDVFVVKLSPAGDLLWAHTLSGPSQQLVSGVAIDPQGEIWMCGSLFQHADFDPGPGSYELSNISANEDGWLWKLDADGSLIWAGAMVDALSGHTYVATNAAGELFVTGLIGAVPVDVDPGPATVSYAPGSQSWGDAYLVKLSANGAYQWSHHLTPVGSGAVLTLGITVDGDGNVISTGQLGGIVDFEPGPGTTELASGSGGSTYVWKVDPSGGLVWAKGLNIHEESQGYGVAVDQFGHVFTDGTYGTEGADLDPGPGVVQVTSAGTWDIFLSALGTDGSYLWSGVIGAELDDQSRGIATDPTGNVLVIGHVKSEVDMDPGATSYPVSALTADPSYFLMKLAAFPEGVEEEQAADALHLYPIPVTGALNIRMDHAMARALVRDVCGAVIIDQRISGPTAQLDLGALPCGTYVLEVIADGGRVSQVIVKD